MRFYPQRFLFLEAILALALVPGLGRAASQVDFNRDIRRILSENCFKCHGPDPAERKGGKNGLRLDMAEGATADLGGHAAIVPGHPDQSEVMRRVTTSDADDKMPPLDSGKRLSAGEIELLRRWIAQGAPYAKHWAYVKPMRPALPEVKHGAWPRNPIDRFILATLEEESLEPALEADRPTLIRRVALDLTGLPPTLEEVEQFVNDNAPGAYSRLVDRFLKKESFGEHWARMWLDQARYADSSGYADDPPRTIWGFRDYVIRSFNANKPFDQFTVEQIAGDLGPDPSEEELVATAFHRNTQTNNEGGTNDEEYRNVAIVDRVNTTMAVWMGTTMACAQCHDHKYDPLTQKDYFEMFAIFNNTADQDRKDEEPNLALYTAEQKQRREELSSEIKRLETVLETMTPKLAAAQMEWEQTFNTDLAWEILRPQQMKSAAGAKMIAEEDGSIRAGSAGPTDTYTLVAPVKEATRLTALRLEALADDSLPGHGPGHAAGNFVISRVSALWEPPETTRLAGRYFRVEMPGAERIDTTPDPAVELSLSGLRPIAFTEAFADYSQKNFDARAILDNKDPKEKGWAVGGGLGQSHQLTLLPAGPVDLPARTKLTVTIEQLSRFENHTVGKLRLLSSNDPRAAEYSRTPAPVLDLLKIPRQERDEAQQARIERQFLAIAPSLQPQRENLAALRVELKELRPYTMVPILRELTDDKRRKTHVEYRGNFLDLGPEVEPGLPSAFHPSTHGPTNRLALAQWLIDPANPLTARVMVNHFWEAIFGIGIVRTGEEFGTQGEPPSHPQLLDWLATDFMAHQWDVKYLLKLMVSSAAYRQSSKVTEEELARDPDNRMLGRGPRFRLSAEMIRDQALAVSGLLSQKMFGPPVNPPQPQTGLTAAFGSGIDWKTSEGQDRYRRAIYTSWRRSNPYPSMATFDAPNREVCMVRRDRTNTPLQALVTLNDPVYIEAAQSLARRLGTGTPEEKARRAFRLCLVRPPKEAELNNLIELHRQAYERFAAEPDKALSMATQPLGRAPEGSDLADLAAWTVVANVMLNLDEMLMNP